MSGYRPSNPIPEYVQLTLRHARCEGAGEVPGVCAHVPEIFLSSGR